jgi:hypothetical protein
MRTWRRSGRGCSAAERRRGVAAQRRGPRLELGREAVGLEGERRDFLAGLGEEVAQRATGAGLGALSAVARAEADVEAALALVERDDRESGGVAVDELGLPAEARRDLELAAVVALEEAERGRALLDEAVDEAQCCWSPVAAGGRDSSASDVMVSWPRAASSRTPLASSEERA